MPNDAKLGLVVGVGLVMLVAVVYFHKDPSANVGSLEAPGQGNKASIEQTANPRTPTTAAPVSRKKEKDKDKAGEMAVPTTGNGETGKKEGD